MNAAIVIAGGGLAAQRCCATLRRSGHEGPITMLCGEDVAPYDRPPLSKEVLAGSAEPVTLALRRSDWYSEHAVTLRLAAPVTALDADARCVQLEDGSRVRYDRLLIATGARPRRLDLLDGAPNVHTLRTLADANALRAALLAGSRLAVVGGGFIGQEVAATARGLGVHVTLLEAMDAPLVGLLGHELGTWFAELHRSHGVDVRCGTAAVDSIRGADGHVTALVLGDGERVACDTVVVGVGVVPADEWLSGSGLGGNGVECDEDGRTALDDVYAAGDVARPYDALAGAHVRSEHWEAAARQGAAAARAMLGLPTAPAPLASFWSDQYGLRIQYLGYASLGDDVTVDGDLAGQDFTAVWRHGGQPVAALLVGRPQELAQMRRVIQNTLEQHERKAMT